MPQLYSFNLKGLNPYIRKTINHKFQKYHDFIKTIFDQLD